MARRPTLGRRGSAAPPTQDNFSMLNIPAEQRAEYSFLSDIHSVQDVVVHLNGEAAKGLDDLRTRITYAKHLGAVWSLLDKHRGDWTVRVGPAEKIKWDNLIEITVPATIRGMLPEKRHQRELVVWDDPPTGQPMPAPAQRSGTLLFQYLRQQQRAMLLDYSVGHLGFCLRIFTATDPERSVEWVQTNTKPQIGTDGTELPPRLDGSPRKAEGVEYIADCIRIHRAYVNARKSKSDEESIAAAQKAINPRTGTRRMGVSASEQHNRLYMLAAHLLSTTAKIGLQSPFSRLFTTPDDLDRWLQMTPYSDADEAAWAELNGYAASPFANMMFPAAQRFYSQPLPPKPDDEGVEERQADTMTDEEVEAANMLAGDITMPTVAWCDIPAKTTEAEPTKTETVILTTRSERSYDTERRALRFGRDANPTASTEDENAVRYMTVEQTAEPTEAGGPMRWVWVLQTRVAGGIIFINTDIPTDEAVFTPAGEPEPIVECPPEETSSHVQELRETRTETGRIIIRRQGTVDVVMFQFGTFERRTTTLPNASEGEGTQPTA